MAKWGRNKSKGFEPLSAQGHLHPQESRMGDLTVGDYANGMPNIRLGEMFKSFLRQMPWVIILFVIGAFIAWNYSKDFNRTYSGDGRILVQFSDDYAYNPVGQSGQNTGLSQTIDTITLTEAAIMKNGEIIDQVIGEMTAARLAPEGYEKVTSASNETDRKIAWMELRNEVGNAYYVMPRAKSSIIDVQFSHENPDIAVETTNAFIDAYMSFRRSVFVEGSDEVISERRLATENQLMSNERAIARFLKNNDISDFASEQKGLQERTESLKASLNGTRAGIAETEAALARVEDQLRQTPETIDLYTDDRAAQRVAQAELELGQLLAKYLPTSDPVRQKQTELNELRALQSTYKGKASGGRRVGPNSTHQELTVRRNTLASTADSLREREFTLQRQLNSADGKIRRLTSLNPEFQNLLRERETLNTRLDSYNAKEQEALVDAQQSAASADNVKVISYAKYPNKGRNMKLLVFAIASMVWGVALLFIAMIRVFLDPRLYSAPAMARREQVIDDPAIIPVAAPAYDPIPEPIPAYEPGQPLAPNPYEMPAATGYADPGYGQGAQSQPAQDYGYSAQSYAAPQAEGYAPTAAYDQYGRPKNEPYTPSYSEPQPTDFQGSAALDLSYNPYASGEAHAGGLETPTGYVDEYGRPVPPPAR